MEHASDIEYAWSASSISMLLAILGLIYQFFFFLVMRRGPTVGFRGKVVLAFEENGSSKIGVRFDKTIPEGNDLGGLCEEDHGFFCAGEFLEPSVYFVHFDLLYCFLSNIDLLCFQLIHCAWRVRELRMLTGLLLVSFSRYITVMSLF